MVKDNAVINWEAQEYIQQNKGAGWYIGFFCIVCLLAGFAIFRKEWSFLVLVIVAAAALFSYERRRPRTLHYSLTKEGISEGNTLYEFDDFRSFGIMEEENHYAIVLMPKRRFGMKATIYFPASEGEQIVDMFGARLPMEKVEFDLIDQIVRWLKI